MHVTVKRTRPKDPKPLLRAALRAGTIALVWSGLGASAAVSQVMPLPVDLQAELIGKVLQFDRTFSERVGDEVVIAVIYQSRFRESLSTLVALEDAFKRNPWIRKRPVRIVPVELMVGESLEEALRAAGASVVYVAPLRAVGIDAITEVTRLLDIVTSTGVPEYVSQGVAFGLSIRGEHPFILVNLHASREEGARFSSELLKLSRVVGREERPEEERSEND